MTYSIVGRDPDTGEIGAAVQSKFPGVGTIVLHGAADAGCLTTQAFSNPEHGSVGLRLLRLGARPAEAIDILLRSDDAREERQVSALTLEAAPASFTGAEVLTWEGHAGSAMGRDCVASGNALRSEAVLADMVATFAAGGGSLTDRLLAALTAGQRAGGELRGMQSAAVLVVRKGGGYAGADGRLVDISVYDHPDPIAELVRCFEIHKLSYFPSEAANLVEISGALVEPLRRMLRSMGLATAEDGAEWSDADIRSLKRFMGSENYDNRLRDDALIDLDVLADIRKKHPAFW